MSTRPPLLPNPYVLADQLVDLRFFLGLSDYNREIYKATQVVVDWLESVELRPDMAGGPSQASAKAHGRSAG